MPLTRAEVEHIAELARIDLLPEEIDRMAPELSSVVDHIARLMEIDVANVDPTSHAVPVVGVMRADEIAPSWPVDAVLANAPHRHADFFQVQAILD